MTCQGRCRWRSLEMVAATWLSADLRIWVSRCSQNHTATAAASLPGTMAVPVEPSELITVARVHGGFLRAAELLDRTAVSCRIVAPISFTLCFQLQH